MKKILKELARRLDGAYLRAIEAEVMADEKEGSRIKEGVAAIEEAMQHFAAAANVS